MSAPKSSSAEHQGIWELIPWFITGRLSDSDWKRTEAHLRQCAVCRDELVAQRHLHQAMRTEAGVEQLPVAGLHRLRQRIEALEASPPEQRPMSREAAGGARGWRRSLRRYSLVASLAGVLVCLGMLGTLWWNQAWHGPSAAYYTVTTPTPQISNAAIRAVFAPSVRLSELQTMLIDAQLKIVSGPTEAGVYSLAVTGSRPVDWSLERLRGHDVVRFAEAIGPLPGPPSPPP